MKIKIEIDLSLDELLKIIHNEEKPFTDLKDIEPMVFYSKHPFGEIKLNDKVEILPSEECVTNADKIKYDESISGLKCSVEGINRFEKTILIKTSLGRRFTVESTWLKKII